MNELRKPKRQSRKNARALRKNMTEAESKLWLHLRMKLLGGYKFRRQHPIGSYITDFACIPKKLIVEVDGATHGSKIEIIYDDKRINFLKSKGWNVVRYGNEEIYKNIDDVLDDIYAHLTELK